MQPAGEFDENLCHIMGTAFDKACAQIPLSALFPELRTEIAKRIISRANNGMLSEDRLRTDAVAAFSPVE
jgi:hypothetical protein